MKPFVVEPVHPPEGREFDVVNAEQEESIPVQSTYTETVIRDHLERRKQNGRAEVVELVVTEGNLGAARLTVTGSSSSDATGSWGETHVYRVEDGEIAEHWPHVPISESTHC